MTPVPGERHVRFVGDRICFALRDAAGQPVPEGWRARLRTNLGRGDTLRDEIVQAHARGLPPAGAAWRDIPMIRTAQGWSLELPLTEVGWFKAKAYALDPRGWQHWPDGPDVGVSVQPDGYRTANTIYCAFPRMFGPTRNAASSRDEKLEKQIRRLDEQGFAVIPPSGKLRDLIPVLPHVVQALGCRILHLLPVSPTPTTYARFGRFGSPYASLDLAGVDPALVVFDNRTTGVDQFCELTRAVHQLGARLFLDIVINHTGWGSTLQENHPEWFLRRPGGEFASPGAWGVTWADLVELGHDNVALWDELAEVFLTWCRRGVDGFRCDAGYMVPMPAWQYIVARVRQEFPETLFLLEGLGGAWELSAALLTEGGMQWAYSELFQNYSGPQIAGYLDHSFKQSQRVGLLVHYSETHDNDRLAARGREWSLLRNRLCALTSVSGGFGFTCGVEWLATEKISVHASRALAWGSPDNLVPALGRLNRLLADHPCFFDGATITRLSEPDSPVYALRRQSAEGPDEVLVLVNADPEKPQSVALAADRLGGERGNPGDYPFDLLGQEPPAASRNAEGKIRFTLPPAAAYCLASALKPVGLSGDAYRRTRAQAAWGLRALSRVARIEAINGLDWRWLAGRVEQSPRDFLAGASRLAAELRGAATIAPDRLAVMIDAARSGDAFPAVTIWTLLDGRRVMPVPPGHWLLVEDEAPFRATLAMSRAADGSPDCGGATHVASIAAGSQHVACFAPRSEAGEALLTLERYADTEPRVTGAIRFLAPAPTVDMSRQNPQPGDVVLLTNGRGGMARLRVDLGRVNSKYDCVLGANLHPDLPVDRHVFVKRIRVWLNADGFLSPLDALNLDAFTPGPPATWEFVANAGDGRTAQVQIAADMLPGQNATVFRFRRPAAGQAAGKELPAEADVRLTVRLDLEDRNFHGETKRNGGAEHHFATHSRPLPSPGIGFTFTPAPDRHLRAVAEAGEFHPQPEWCENLAHPVEASRGQVASGDAYSPGWFELPLPKGADVSLVISAESTDAAVGGRESTNLSAGASASNDGLAADDSFDRQLLRAARAFVVRRGTGRTVIAGYPWFLDWGRDSLICARGLLAGGFVEEVRDLLVTFAGFEDRGTLPNTIHGADASNRDTSDAPLWFGVVCEEIAGILGQEFYDLPVRAGGRTLREVLRDIANHYRSGTPNGIRMDAASALVWSPNHFTWMDTNHPAGTPREGYPVEIQALWIRLLRQLRNIDQPSWGALADRALASLEEFFWREDFGWFADVLPAAIGQPAAGAVVDAALRSNALLPISLGLVGGDRARRTVAAALRYLVVPGALRSLAPLPVTVPLPIRAADGRLLNDPSRPYWGRYEGDEDTRRKPAYHNGTAWTWTFPHFCEALARAWDFSPEAIATARAYLGSMDRLLLEGCLGQVPEVLDGDAPHAQHGCDAQAWGATEALRVWRLLQRAS